MSKALTNSLALLQQIKSQLAAGDASDRNKQRPNTFLDRKQTSSPHKTSTSRNRLEKPERFYDLPKAQIEYTSKGSIRNNNPYKTSRLNDCLRQIKDRQDQAYDELQRKIIEEFDSFIDRMHRKMPADTVQTLARIVEEA